MKSRTLIIAAVVVVVAVAALLIYRQRNRPKSQGQTLRDSVFYHTQKAQQYDDSATFHRGQADQAYQHYRDVSGFNWDSARAAYTAELRGKILAEHARQRDTLRAAEAGGN